MEQSAGARWPGVCDTGVVCSPALSQSVVAEVENELVKRVRLLSDLLLLLFLHFGLRFLDKVIQVNAGARGMCRINISYKVQLLYITYLRRIRLYQKTGSNRIH